MWDAIIGAGGSILGGLIGAAGAGDRNNQQIAANREAARMQQEMAREQMQFQERMSSTAYQRSMADMKAAGLNPILAYQKGGASTPGGAMGNVQPAQLENVMESLGEGVSSAAQKSQSATAATLAMEQKKQSASQTELNNASADLSKANTVKANQDTATSAAQMQKANAEAALVTEQLKNPEVYRQLMGAQAYSAQQQGRLSGATADQVGKTGPGIIGQGAYAIEELGKRLMRGLGNMTGGGGTSAKERFYKERPHLGVPHYTFNERLLQERSTK